MNAPSRMTVSPGQRLGAGWGEDGEGRARRSLSSGRKADAEARSAPESRPKSLFFPARPHSPTLPP